VTWAKRSTCPRSAGRIYLLAPLALISPHVAQTTLTHLNTAFSSSSASTTNIASGKPVVPDAKWVRPSEDERDRGMMIIIEVQGTPKQVTWHRKGDYFATVAVDGVFYFISNNGLKALTNTPFRSQLRTSLSLSTNCQSIRLSRHSSVQRVQFSE
jgi:ribosome biogenesis protein ERB1